MAVCAEDLYGMQMLQRIPKKLTIQRFLPRWNKFLGIAPLSHGVVILSCFYGIMAIISITVNMMLYDPIMSFACLLVYIFGCYILVTWVTASVGVIRVNKAQSFGVRRALVMWTIFIVVWTFLVVFSFSEYGATLLCVEHRCPETYWIYNETWHDLEDPDVVYRPPSAKDNFWDTFAAVGDDVEPVRVSPPRYEWESTPSLLTVLITLAMQEDTGTLMRIAGVGPDKDYNNSVANYRAFDKRNRDRDDKHSANHNTKNLIILLAMIMINAVQLIYSWLILFNCKLNIEQCVREAEIPRTQAAKASKKMTVKLLL